MTERQNDRETERYIERQKERKERTEGKKERKWLLWLQLSCCLYCVQVTQVSFVQGTTGDIFLSDDGGHPRPQTRDGVKTNIRFFSLFSLISNCRRGRGGLGHTP